MTTTAFQWVLDNAVSISINRKAVVAQTVARNQTVRSISIGGQVWRFDVRVADGLRWSDIRGYIEQIDYADRYTPATIQFNRTGYNSWLTPYQGNNSNPSVYTATGTQGATTINLNAIGTIASGYHFRSGDLIQLGSTGRVYSVVGDVPYSSRTVTLNRPIIDSTFSGISLITGVNVTWTVNCLNLPDWTIFARDQVSWSGSFQFIESFT